MDYIQLKWRVGEKVRRTIYAVTPDSEHDDHPLIGLMDTPELAIEVVAAHNREAVSDLDKKAEQMTFGEKELLIKDLMRTDEIYKTTNDLEASIMGATSGGVRAKRVYTAVGFSVNVLGEDVPVPDAIRHAINIIRSQ